jgi:hypothetical protein
VQLSKGEEIVKLSKGEEIVKLLKDAAEGKVPKPKNPSTKRMCTVVL